MYYIKLLQVSSNNSEFSISIKNILHLYTDGRMIINYYENFKNLNNSMRNNLASVIIKHELKNDLHNTKISKTKFIDLAKGKNYYIFSIILNL